MALKVTVTNPDLPKETLLAINGLGLFENGKSRELTEEEEQAYVAQTGMSVKDGTHGDANIKVEGTATVKTTTAKEGGEE